MNAKIVVIFLLALISCLGFFNKQTEALSVDVVCGDVGVIFARGSGEKLNDAEYARLKDQLSARLGTGVKTNIYELGAESYGGKKYPAVDVGKWWENGNAIGASLSAGLGNDYGKSVTSGVVELQSYLNQRFVNCPNEQIVLGGYSQGAQVIGQTLPLLSTNIQDKINFVALFGDPKLYLPEGEGAYPQACLGGGFSSWRRVIGDCHADNGALGARKPFLPESMVNKTGLWCNAHDFICGTSKLVGDVEGHGQYKNSGNAIDQATVEIALRLQQKLPVEKAQSIDIGKHVSGIGTSGMDVAFMITASGWTPERFQQAKEFISRTAKDIYDRGGRIGLATYDGVENAMGMGVLQFDYEDFDYFQMNLDQMMLQPPRGPLKPTLRAMTYMLNDNSNNMNWRSGAAKSLVVLTDSDFFNPDDFGYTTIARVARLALELDPVNIYPVVSDQFKGSFQAIADATSGAVIPSTSDTAGMVAEATKNILQKPTVILKNTEYSADVNQEITFDASDSYAVDASLTKFEWDFDGDGVFEQTTTTPTVRHAYEGEYYLGRRGVMQVRATASNGMVSNGSARFVIGVNLAPIPPQPVTNLTATVQSTSNNTSTVLLNWQPSDNLASSWVISMNGAVLGKIDGSRTNIQITDVDRGSDVEFSVTGLTSQGTIGIPSSTTLEKIVVQPPESNPPSYTLLDYLRKLIRHILKFLHF